MITENHSNIVRTIIPISELEHGMTVELNGIFFTVNRKDIRKDELFGWSFRGDASRKEITRIQFAVPTANGITIR